MQKVIKFYIVASNFSKKLIPQKNKIYFVSYIDGTDNPDYIEFYCVINTIINDFFYFTITDFLKGNEDNKFLTGIQMLWQQKDFDNAYITEMSSEELKDLGRCPKCGKMSFWGPRASLKCPEHGAWAGL